MIKVENVTKNYQSGKVKVKAIHDVSLEIRRGEFIALTGPSGSGKTTLLNIIGCLTRITKGSLWLDDQEVSHFPDHFLSAVRRDKIGFIFQQFNLISGYTTWENVSLPLVPMGVSEKMRRARALKLLEHLNLETRADFMANELSGGEQQRTAFARALINNPEIILADEPFSNIDVGHVKMVIDILADLKKRGKTIVTSLHDSNTPVVKLVDHTVYFDSGKISAHK
ncbi:MAG: ABC transporter ATP-binding protein [Thermodesulfobacteriota bacterium]|nr:ABC transporter ATP-binding protein [Thermodesulfobacteriota bacterium]